jgi:hypothetical protein
MKRIFKSLSVLVLVLALGIAWLLVVTFLGRRATLDR